MPTAVVVSVCNRRVLPASPGAVNGASKFPFDVHQNVVAPQDASTVVTISMDTGMR